MQVAKVRVYSPENEHFEPTKWRWMVHMIGSFSKKGDFQVNFLLVFGEGVEFLRKTQEKYSLEV